MIAEMSSDWNFENLFPVLRVVCVCAQKIGSV